ncbi:alpha/beta-hydrolase [Wallemia mellicola CBS 633.66]|uniref:Alpha/beta-hydrolase n=1 Tax=Wallemia mellicola (strain ATCC MYA-4683 / CBS 633.66) TaxID=671144 RepID=I4YDV6_WALMC|nr:alpha/beta-hydrolase [Wallemia mellicola CBS 633.66]EIM22148.1 alpha/beta-hydrolase [Wallemia mellicola CBS 633.66]|eukprot:XP_006957948.1 alpha/beta-hydrolase [Wallemia mellicola CBS 633.66]
MPTIPTLVSTIVGLPLSLWTFKCMMLVAFQRRIIYMGYSPIGARQELLRDIDTLGPFDVRKISADVSPKVRLDGLEVCRKSAGDNNKPSILFYLQGNAGNPLSRLPVFHKLLHDKACVDDLKIIAFAPSSYWTSSRRRPTQTKLLEDYRCALQKTCERYPESPIFIYGHSLGGAISTILLAEHLHDENINGLILENAFGSIPDMIKAYFISPRIPYWHLHRLAFDKWDAKSVAHKVKAKTLILISENDELVPRAHGEALHSLISNSQLEVIQGALHENAYTSTTWSRTVSNFIKTHM